MSLSEEEQQRRLQKILNQKKKTDLAGLLKAQREGTLDEYLAADLEKAGLTTGEGETQAPAGSSGGQRVAAAAPSARGASHQEASANEDAPAWARAVEQLSSSQTGVSSVQHSSYYPEEAEDEEYEGYAESDDDYVNVHGSDRPTDSGVPAWLANKNTGATEPDAPTNARPYSINLTGQARLQAQSSYDQGYDHGYDDQYYADQDPYDEHGDGEPRTYASHQPQAAGGYDETYDQGNYDYEDIEPVQEQPPAERTMSNPDRIPPPIPATSPVANMGVGAPNPAWANESNEEQQQQPQPSPVVPRIQKVADEKTLKYAKYLSGVTVMCAVIVFVMVIVDMAIGFKDESKYFVGIFLMVLALGMLGFETKNESFDRFVAAKFGFMFFPLGRFCFNFLVATLCFGLAIASIIAGAITVVYAFGTAWLMILYPALPQHIRDVHGVDMFSSVGPTVCKGQDQQSQPQPQQQQEPQATTVDSV